MTLTFRTTMDNIPISSGFLSFITFVCELGFIYKTEDNMK